MIEFSDLDMFTTGAVGPPGARVFYLQATDGPRVVSLKLEKGQVAALAQYMTELLVDLATPEPGEIPDDVDLIEPVQAAWVVGSIGVAFDSIRDRMLIRADEVEIEGEPPPEGSARFVLTRGQVVAFVARAAMLVVSGRPPCPLCGRPLDESHSCPKTNGHRST